MAENSIETQHKTKTCDPEMRYMSGAVLQNVPSTLQYNAAY